MINLRESEKNSQTKKQLIKLEAKALKQKARLDSDALEQKATLDEINHRRELEVLEARRALVSEGHENRNEFIVYQVVRMLPKWTASDIDTFLTSFEKLAITNNWPRDKYLAIIQTQMSPKALKIFNEFPTE